MSATGYPRTTTSRIGIWLSVGVLACGLNVLAQAPQDESKKELESITKVTSFLAEEIGPKGWETEYNNIEHALGRIWNDNGWHGESDRFALDVARGIMAIPPWRPLDRIDLAVRRYGQRFGLQEDQMLQMKGFLGAELVGLLSRHGELILEQAGEAFEARRDKQPFTAEQVARWVKDAEPMSEDAKAAVERMIGEFKKVVGPEKQEILERDLESYRNRTKHFDELTEQWKKGEWRAEHWGMQSDPIQSPRRRVDEREGEIADANGADSDRRRPIRGQWFPYDPETWVYYVHHVKEHFQFDASQFNTAESIHSEVAGRAREYMKSRKESLEAIRFADRATHAEYAEIRALFEGLQERLDALPTSTQRETARDKVRK